MSLGMIKQHWILVLILLFAFFIRFYHVATLPIVLNLDEAALGYNAYSLLKTGADEHGKFFPLALQSFGDWKLPVYPYLSMLPIALFGLTPLAVRLPSVLAGVISVFLLYQLSLLLFQKKPLALIAAFFCAVSPWSIYFSRAAYEVNVATMFFLAGMVLVTKYLFEKQRGHYLLVASVFFGLTFFTYHSYIVFLPLLLGGIYFVYRLQFGFTKQQVLAAGIFATFLLLSFLSTQAGGAKKFTTSTIFSNPDVIYSRADWFRTDGVHTNDVVNKLLHNRYAGVGYQIIQNYVSTFSPYFLFDRGGFKTMHNTGSSGNLYVFDALLMTIGIISMLWRREKVVPLLLLWLCIGPIPASLTLDAQNSTRLFMLMPVYLLLAAYGAYAAGSFLFHTKYIFRSLFGVLFVGLFLINILYVFDIYFVHFNFRRANFWGYGYKKSVDIVKEYPSDHVVISGPDNFPYIYVLFYTAYDPAKFQKEAKYYPPTDEGFVYVKSFGKYSFPINLDHETLQKNTLYITDKGFGRSGYDFLPGYQLDGQVAFRYLLPLK